VTSNKFIHIQSDHCAGLLDAQNILSADTDISRQTEGHSFGDLLISESVSVMPSSVIEASIDIFTAWKNTITIKRS
jgi:hypothetical protein